MDTSGASPERVALEHTHHARPGRKRDQARNGVIVEAALVVLAEQGYDRMTIDMVAARAGMARATVYRRWATKADLVLDAVSQTSRGDVDIEHLPDTGTLRGDLSALIRSFDDEEQQVRLRAMAGLLAIAGTDDRLAEVAVGAGLEPWVTVNRLLIQRAIDRGEVSPPVDLDTLAELIPQLCLARAVQRRPITPELSLTLIDGVIIPALRGAG